MEEKKDIEGNRFLYQINGALTIFDTAQVWLEILPHIKEQSSVEIDLSRVDECDAAGLQLLLVLAHQARISDRLLYFSHINEVVLSAFDQCGLESRRFME